MEDCLFCQIAAGKIPSKKVYEDAHVLAFYDIEPKAPVHVLVIPKCHVAGAREITALLLINPDNPVGLCDALEKDTGIPVVLMDANDIEQNQLGKCHDFPLTDAQIQDAMQDNPSGQGDELTPLILIRPVQA